MSAQKHTLGVSMVQTNKKISRFIYFLSMIICMYVFKPDSSKVVHAAAN